MAEKLYAKVLLDKQSNLILTYGVEDKYKDIVKQGVKVKIPLKKQEKIGTVLEVYASNKVFKYPIKNIIGIDEEKVLLKDNLFRLISWIAKYYNEPEEYVMKAFLPFDDKKVRKAKYTVEAAELIDEFSKEIYDQLRKSAPKQAVIYNQFNPKLNNNSSSGIPLKTLGGRSDALKRLITKNILQIKEVVWKDENLDLDKWESILSGNQENEKKLNFAQTINHDLTEEQDSAYKFACNSLNKIIKGEKAKPILLHGVTGSGKTEIFIRIIERALHSGKSVLYLVPEIQLAIEVKKYLISRFPNEVIIILHSQISTGRRMRDWKRIKDGICKIVLGTRSSLFAPLNDLGLIIVDEEHESAYKQEFSPRYNARDAAIVRANFENSLIILGSATPSLESYKNAQDKKYDYLTLKKRIESVVLPNVNIINMLREEVYREQKSKIFSKKLIQAIFDRLKLKEQVILFINRRGFASFIQCQSCGESVSCSNCSAALRYHKSKKALICHFCGFRAQKSKTCIHCKSEDVVLIGFGTEKISEMLTTFFKHSNIGRIDTDLSENERSECIEKFAMGKIDILVGTQMIAKGFHFPRVTLVGVINADQGMNVPDFRCSEKSFQLLTQVSGRSGRGDRVGEVLIQTSVPHNSIIQFSKNHNFVDFAEEELEMRKQFNFAPFFRVSIIRCYSEVESLGENFINKFTENLKNILLKKYPNNVFISDALPSPIEKIERRFRFQVMIRSKSNKIVVDAFNEVKKNTRQAIGIKVFLDVDAMQFT